MGNRGFDIWHLNLYGGPGDKFVLILWAVAFGSVMFCLAKGKFGFAILAFVAPGLGIILCLVGAVRIAKPRSAWARWLYEREAMETAIERFEPPIDLDKIPPRGSRPPVNGVPNSIE